MLVQALAEYADTYLREELRNIAFETKQCQLWLEIGPAGEFLGWVQRFESVLKGKKEAPSVLTHTVPRSPVSRVSGVHPLLAYDDAKYVFGRGSWTDAGQESDHERKHAAFVSLLEEAARVTGDESLKACVLFYGRPEEVAKAVAQFDEKAKPGILLSVYPNGPVFDRETVREFWRSHYDRKFKERNEGGGEGMCLISGRVGQIAPTHDKIKGAGSLGGQGAGVSLMSFDKDAFRSYGWDQNANSPVSPERAQAYVLALNNLLGGWNKSRKDWNGTGFLFWLRRPQAQFDPMSLLDTADPEAVRRLLEIRTEGWRSVEPNDFYLLAVCGNGGRLQVKQWFHETLSSVLDNVASWFDGLAMADVFKGRIADPPKMWQLLSALARDEPPPGRAVELVRRALHGQPLGASLLASLLNRLRAEQGKEKLNTARAGLLRLAVNDELARSEKGDSAMKAELNQDERHPAYLCGRLLALFDGLQYQASGGNVNQTVADRYYTLASTHPQLAFPKIEDLGMKHMRKVRRDKPGAAVAIERRMDEVHEELGGVFPAPLSLVDQGRFALGFHHQRADSMKRAMEAKQQKEGEQE